MKRLVLNKPVIAVAGSSGKTTTKEMIASILGTRWKVYKPSTRITVKLRKAPPVTFVPITGRQFSSLACPAAGTCAGNAR